MNTSLHWVFIFFVNESLSRCGYLQFSNALYSATAITFVELRFVFIF